MDKLPYDETSPKSIETYAKALIGKTFKQVEDESPFPASKSASSYGSKRRKGGLGNLLEEAFFGYGANSEQEPDFPEAGVELKVTPVEKGKDKALKAGERLVLTMISYTGPVERPFEASHLWKKCNLILLICYLREQRYDDNRMYEIKFAKLFTPPAKDLAVIRHDYDIIISKIEAGRAHELSESDTSYLGACTKWTSSEQSMAKQYYGSKKQAKRRAFCYKTSYMTFVINEYMATDTTTYEPIIKDERELASSTFEEIITAKIANYCGKTEDELFTLFDVNPSPNNKGRWATLTCRMLGISSNNNKPEEFEKAHIEIKTIRLEANGKIKESMSFPTFKFKELILEEWETSSLRTMFDETRFFIVVIKKDEASNVYRLVGSQFWNMPYRDLEGYVRTGWEKVVETARNGIVLTPVQLRNGRYIVKNNLLKQSGNPIIHVRPHTSSSFYRLADGREYGSGDVSDTDETPSGELMTKQCFWLNNSYVLSQLKDSLK